MTLRIGTLCLAKFCTICVHLSLILMLSVFGGHICFRDYVTESV